MKAKVKIPKGWYRLREGTKVRLGDKIGLIDGPPYRWESAYDLDVDIPVYDDEIVIHSRPARGGR